MFKIDSAIIRKAKGNPSNIKRLQSIIENQNTLDPIENYLAMTKTELNEINTLMKQRALAKNSNSDHHKPPVDSSSSQVINETNLNKTESNNQQPIVMRSNPDREVKSTDLPTDESYSEPEAKLKPKEAKTINTIRESQDFTSKLATNDVYSDPNPFILNEQDENSLTGDFNTNAKLVNIERAYSVIDWDQTTKSPK